MIRQVEVIIKKEWCDVVTTFFSNDNLMAGVLSTGMFCAVAGIYEPAKMGLEWLHSPIMVFFLVLMIPLSIISFISPDSFVGERRRNTLEPLLATPISNLAILYGKIGIPTLLGFELVVLNMMIGLITVNLTSLHSGLFFYPPGIVVGVITLGFLVSILLAILGTSISLYSHTLLEAQNKMGMLLFLPMVLAASFVSPYTPERWKTPVINLASGFGTINLFLSIAVILIIINIALFVWIKMRLNRKQLIF